MDYCSICLFITGLSQEIRTLFHSFDKDNHGYIDYNEFCEALLQRERKGLSSKASDLELNMADCNNEDGTIKKTVVSMSIPLGDNRELARIHAAMDLEEKKASKGRSAEKATRNYVHSLGGLLGDKAKEVEISLWEKLFEIAGSEVQGCFRLLSRGSAGRVRFKDFVEALKRFHIRADNEVCFDRLFYSGLFN